MASVKNVVFDTNVVLTELLGHTRDAKRCRAYLLDTFGEIRCAVVLHEVMRGSHRPRPGEGRTPAWQVLESMSCVRVVTPDLSDWRTAGLAIQEMNDRCNYQLGKEMIRKMTNDSLIAAVCVRHGLTLLTADRDFGGLKATRCLKGLLILDWNRLRIDILTD